MADYKSEFTGAQIDDGIKKARSALQPTGATMTGPLILSGDPASAKEAATKEYVDNHSADSVVQYVEQTLTADQQATARTNIAAAGQDEVTQLSNEIEALKMEGDGEVIMQSGSFVEMDCDKKTQVTVKGDTSEAVRLFHCGKNMLPAPSGSTQRNGCTLTANADGTVVISGTPTATTYFEIATASNPMYLPAGQYAMIPYNFPDVESRIMYVLESVEGSSVFNKAVTIDKGINNFTLDAGQYVKTVYCVRPAYTGEEINVGVMLVRTGSIVADKPEYEVPKAEVLETTLPTAVTSYKGTNIFYTDGANVLTAMAATGKKSSSFNFASYGLPVLYLSGDTSAMTKDDAVNLSYEYGGLTGTASVKWQGSSSLTYPKKNFTVKFDQAFEAVEGWGAQKKYCMKANYVDFSHSRNIVAAKLWGQIVASRNPTNEALAACPNYGAIDGFPIIIAINDEFAGVYTFNIPKDGWMLNMGSGTNEAILCADLNSDADNFKAEAVVGGNYTDFELEYVSDENNTDWVQTSLNNLINACIASDGTDLDTTIAAMLDWDSAIDYTIFCALIDHRDGVGKNYLLHTWDGVKWYFDAYDMDSIFGNKFDGKSFFAAQSGGTTFGFLKGRHRVAELIMTYKLDELKERYKELRAGVLSEDNVATMFINFAGQIPIAALNEDNLIWPTVPSTNVNNVHQIIDWYRLRVQKIDAEIDAM